MTSVRAGLVTRSPQRTRGRPVEGHHAAVRARPGRLRTSGVPRGRGAEPASWRSTRTRCARRWTTSSPASTDVTAIWSARSAGTPTSSPTASTHHASSPNRECCCWVRHSPTSTRSRARRCATPAWSPTPTRPESPPGSLRFVMSVRGIGEGHRSSIGFRTGVVDAAGDVTIDDPAPFATVGTVVPTLLDGRGVP